MDLSDARKKISRLVETKWRNSYDAEIELLEAWRLIQEELNWASIRRGIDDAEAGRLSSGEDVFNRLECRGQGSEGPYCDECAEELT